MTRKHSGKPFFLGAMIGSSLAALSVLALKMRKGNAFKKFGRSVGEFVQGSKETIQRVACRKKSRKR
jgi:gas vesicle protein